MKKYTVYKLLDEHDKVLWVGSTPLPIETRLQQHRMLLMDFSRHEVDRVYKTQKGAIKREDELLQQHVDKHGDLPLYVLAMFA